MGWRTSDHKRGREIHFSVEKSFNHTARGERTPDCVCGSHPWWDKAEDNDDFSFIRKENFPSLSVDGRIIQFSLDARSQQRCSRAVFFFLFNVTVRGWEVFLGSQGFRSRQSFSLTSHFFTLFPYALSADARTQSFSARTRRASPWRTSATANPTATMEATRLTASIPC